MHLQPLVGVRSCPISPEAVADARLRDDLHRASSIHDGKNRVVRLRVHVGVHQSVVGELDLAAEAVSDRLQVVRHRKTSGEFELAGYPEVRKQIEPAVSRDVQELNSRVVFESTLEPTVSTAPK